ncbi:hypothetical protein I4F81_004449 [Pyropia yezoensis]|uniref:Uncharacterized protein n=1 Tax=Pyropia yezoensis TaxID=2788 RepID=A0ACC3BVA7_PYRYE|nr:hypothetical protein I4F81_004449 [Neopyropia yezoensis]
MRLYLWLGSPPPPKILMKTVCLSCWRRGGRPDWTQCIGVTATTRPRLADCERLPHRRCRRCPPQYNSPSPRKGCAAVNAVGVPQRLHGCRPGGKRRPPPVRPLVLQEATAAGAATDSSSPRKLHGPPPPPPAHRTPAAAACPPAAAVPRRKLPLLIRLPPRGGAACEGRWRHSPGGGATALQRSADCAAAEVSRSPAVGTDDDGPRHCSRRGVTARRGGQPQAASGGRRVAGCVGSTLEVGGGRHPPRSTL